MKTVFLILTDGDCCISTFLVKTELDKQELQEKIKEVVDFFEEGDDTYDWCYEDVVNELEARGYLEIVPVDDEYEIYL
jgi:hypothetical protein